MRATGAQTRPTAGGTMASVVIALAIVASACSYAPTPADPPDTDAPIGVSPDGPSDAADPPAPTWVVVETIVVDTANPNPMTSQLVLESLVPYRLRVSGTITNVIDNFEGDADYFDFNAPKDHGCCEDIGLGIDDLVVNDKDTKPDWGVYRVDHIYEAEWVGEGRAITALFQDTFYGNNIGNLTLEILVSQ